MSLKPVTATEAAELMASGAALVDIRTLNERAAVSIPGSIHYPLGSTRPLDVANDQPVIFHCQSGMRTSSSAASLAKAAPGAAYSLTGGIAAWQAAALPIETGAATPAPAFTFPQVFMAAVLAGSLIMGLTTSPYWFGLAALMAVSLFYGRT